MGRPFGGDFGSNGAPKFTSNLYCGAPRSQLVLVWIGRLYTQLGNKRGWMPEYFATLNEQLRKGRSAIGKVATRFPAAPVCGLGTIFELATSHSAN